MVKLIGQLTGNGSLVADTCRFASVNYDIDIWSADNGLTFARGTISVSPQVGPAELTLEDGMRIRYSLPH